MDRKRRAAMMLPPAFSRLNRSSGRVPKVMTGSANVTVSGRAPAAVWPESSPENCQDFLDCVGGTGGVKLGAKLGECCTKWLGDTVVQNTYCRVVGSQKQLTSLTAICQGIRWYAHNDDEAKDYADTAGVSLSDAVAACEAVCNAYSTSARPRFCDAWALSGCLESSSSSEGLCCGKYYNARGFVPGKCTGPTFDYQNDCLASDGVPTGGRGQLCNDFCDNINKDIDVTVYRYGSVYYCDWDDYCGTARAFRECVGGSGDVGKCCALHDSQATGCSSQLSSDCYSYPSTREPVCNSYCDNIDPYSSKSTGFCAGRGYAKCSAATLTTALLPECCAYNPWDSGRQHCLLSVYDTRYEEGQFGYETTRPLTELCSLLRGYWDSGVPCGLEVSKSTLDGYCTRFCNSLDQRSRRHDNFWWCDADAYASYFACVAGVEVGEYLEERRRVDTYHSRHFEYDPYESLQDWARELGDAWETAAKCCGENPAAGECGSTLRYCEQLYDSKYNDQRDEIDDFEFPETGDDIQELFSRAAEVCRTICKNTDDEPGWCDNVPGRRLLAGEIAAIVLGCVLFVAIVGIVVLVILYLKKPGVGGAPSTG